MITALAAPGFLLAANAPRIKAPINQGAMPLWREIMREIWRCVTWLSSWAITDANSSRLVTTPTSPRCKPMYAPGRANALTVRSRPSKISHA
jgi:hypothetical protein